MDINKKLRLASKYHREGNLQRAEITYKQILEFDPNNIHILNYLGNVFQDQRKYDEAIDCYQKAIHVNPAFAGSYYHLGSVFEVMGQDDKAINYYQKAIQYDPNFAGSYNNLGNVYRKSDRLDEAIPYFQKAIEVNPDFWGSYYNLGEVLQNKGKLDEAISLFQKALQLNPKHIASLNNLGNCLKDKGSIDEAITCYQKAIAINPNFAESFYNLGVVLQNEGQLDEAIAFYQKALQIDPNGPNTHLNMAFSLLLLGNFKQGWKEYEWRWKIKDLLYQRSFPQPLWNRTNIKDLTILIHAEQGLGDVIQFIRYAPFVAQLGATVIVECHKELKSLLTNVEGVHHVISKGEELPSFDIHCPIASLPLIFNTMPDNIPTKIPYIYLEAISVKKWKNRLRNDNSKINVGLVWAGSPTHKNDGNRSMPLSRFLPLTKFTDTTFYSLQKGTASEQTKNLPVGMKFIDLTEGINDFSDTAALIENLDLLISS